VNINLVYYGLVVELQVHLAEVLQVADKQHVAYEAARELDLMGVLEKPDPSLSEAAPIEMKVAYNLARFVPALLSLFIAILYLDVFTFKGLRLIVRRADPTTWRGFKQPYIVHRVYGIALAAPYLANVYMLARAAGLFGKAAKDARRGRTRVGLLYEKYFGYEGSHFVWKVFCFQIVEVALQAMGKIPLFMTYTDLRYTDTDGGNATYWFVYVFILALLVNVLYPTFLLRSRLVRYQRDVSFVADTFLDIVYALTPFVFMLSGIRSQAMLIPHEPVAYVSNLIPLMHAHFVIATLERAGAEARALKRVAPDEIAAEEAPKRAVAGDAAPDEAAGIDAPAPDASALPDDASAEASKPVPLGATPAGRRYCCLIGLCLFFWTLATGFFYTWESPTFWFVSEVLKIKSSCTWPVEKWTSTWQERACDRPCEEIPGCSTGWCDVYSGECVKSTSDERCVGKADRFELGHDEWCKAGLRVYECDDEDDEDDEDEDSFSYLYSYADEDEDADEEEDAGEDENRCSREWPESPGDYPYEVFTDSGKCRSQDWAEPDRAHDEDVGTVANIGECWRRCQGLNEDGKTSYCASMHQSTMECSCQGADSFGDFYEFDCLVDVGEYTLAVHQDWRGSRCHSDGRHVCGCDDEDYCLPYDACCVEHEFDATGEVVSTTCHWDRSGVYEGGRSPWEAATMSKLCTAGHSDAGAVAPAYRDCSQEALDAGRCGTGDWDTCAECADFDIPTGNYFANVGYTSCPNWVFDAISEDAADGGTCSDAWNKRTDFGRFGEWRACSWQLWLEFAYHEEWFTKLVVVALLSLVCLPFTLSFLALPTFAERAGRRVASVWRRTVGFILFCFVVLLGLLPNTNIMNFGPSFLICFLVVMGYTTAVVTEERVKVGAYCSVVIFLTVPWITAIGYVVLGSAAVAFAPRRGEREKVRSAVFTTKASVAADRGRLPRWACCVYLCATVTFIALASSGQLSTIDDRCSPCNCINDKLVDCYADARTLEVTDSYWNGIKSYLPERLHLQSNGIKAIEPGAFKDMARLDRLELRGNCISTIEPYTFAGLRKLWQLELEKNKIHIVKSNAFRGLPRLANLHLHGNQINRIENGAFAGLHNLVSLRLDWNQINRIEHMAFAGLDTLRGMDLSWNQINIIEDGAFAGLDSLRGVNLRGNPVTCADAHAAGLPQSVECQGY
jgi:hypothetical protein